MLSTVLTTAQEVLNGSFEDNSYTTLPGNGCNYDNPCEHYHQKMAHSNAWETEALNLPLCFVGGVSEGCTQYFNPEYVWPPPSAWRVVGGDLRFTPAIFLGFLRPPSQCHILGFIFAPRSGQKLRNKLLCSINTSQYGCWNTIW